MRRSGPCNLKGVSRGRRGGLEGLLELLEVVSASFWCQEHVLRFRGKSPPQPLLTPGRSPRSTPASQSPASILPLTTSRGDGEKKKRERKSLIPPTFTRGIIEPDERRGIRKKRTVENALLANQEPIAPHPVGKL